ncbi:cell division protein FtsZ [Burkholderiales bacterium GJ-E10]|nr:cell division protein FtsZ [Burkholderiales bacterium GJ-E10]
MAFEILETETAGTVIKVIGVGGAGGNAVEHMIQRGVQGVDFICANTDHQALSRSSAKNVIQLGKTGLGAGSRPEMGRAAAEEARDRIADALRGAHMVFITAGMGGGTGTGAAPVVAEVAKELGILTVAVVSKPFEFEGPKRAKVADAGLGDLQDNVHSMIVILNSKLEEVLGEDAEMADCFRTADDVLHNACAGIAEIINTPGLVNVDFEDVKTVMSEHGKAMMGTATASGTDRARVAAEQAVACPLLEGVDLSGARGVLVNITASGSLKMKETSVVMNTIRAFAAEDATVIFGAVRDDSMGDSLRVTVVATGLGRAASVARKPSLTVLARTGTDNAPMTAPTPMGAATPAPSSATTNYGQYDMPAVFRTRAVAGQSADEVGGPEMRFEIPAFLRKQAD